jgi:glycosyltransferase involved in cell wall biosynthesis
MRVDVIMRSKNSDWVIHQALAGLFSQTHRDFELLVVDSGSADRTLEIVRQFPGRLIEIEAKEYYPGNVLNMAIEATTADVVVFQNSDVVPLAPSALERLLAPFEDPAVQATFARQLPRPEAHTWVRRDYAMAFPERGQAPPWMYYSLPLAAMRRSAWQEHRFYGDAWGSEDTEWGHWARSHGKIVRYVADSIVMHSHNYTLRQLYGRRFIEGEADAFIFRARDSVPRMCLRLAKSVGNDLFPHARAGDLSGLAMAPLRRAVYQWAYYKGHRLGESRIATGNTDASIGQTAVLSRHDSKESREPR